jgi:multiple sugar transport system substrate-binding protein
MRRLLTVFSILTLVFAGAVVGYAQSPVVIQLWNGIGPPEGDVLSEFVKEFNAQNEGRIVIEETILNWDTLYTKLMVDFRTGNAPDILTFHQPALAQYTSLGVLQELDDYVDAVGIVGTDFVETAWNGGVIDGKRYAIAIDMHPWALYYNRELFRQAGLPDRAPQNMEEFIEFAQKLTYVTEDGVQQYGFGMGYAGADPHRLLISLLAQKGKSILTPDFKQAQLNNDDTKEVLQFMYDLIYKYKVVPERESDVLGDFLRGSVAMIIDGPWNLPSFIADEDLDFGTAPIPRFYDQDAVWGSSHVLVFPRNNNEDKLKAAMEFAAFVTTKGFEWTVQAGHMPIRKDILESEEFKKLEEWQAFAKSLPNMVYYPPIVEYSLVFSHDPSSPLVEMTESVLLNKASIDAAVKRAEDNFNRILGSN